MGCRGVGVRVLKNRSAASPRGRETRRVDQHAPWGCVTPRRLYAPPHPTGSKAGAPARGLDAVGKQPGDRSGRAGRTSPREPSHAGRALLSLISAHREPSRSPPFHAVSVRCSRLERDGSVPGARSSWAPSSAVPMGVQGGLGAAGSWSGRRSIAGGAGHHCASPTPDPVGPSFSDGRNQLPGLLRDAAPGIPAASTSMSLSSRLPVPTLTWTLSKLRRQERASVPRLSSGNGPPRSLAVISLPRWTPRLHVEKCRENALPWDGLGRKTHVHRPSRESTPLEQPVNGNHLLLEGFSVSFVVLLNIRNRREQPW